MSKSPVRYALILLSLALSWLVIDSIFTLIVRPQAQLELQMAAEAGLPAPRTWAIMFKDLEQELCVVLFVWAVVAIGVNASKTNAQFKLLTKNYVPRDEDSVITPDQAEVYYRNLQKLEETAEREAVLPQMLMTSLNHFNGTRDIGSATSVAHQVSDLKADQMEAELSLVRYVAWAIPSFGFVGTVRGIGVAMTKAGEALEGDITGVTESLGVAFNSTLVALALSIVLMLFMHLLQMRQDTLIQRCHEYCNKYLLSHLSTSG